MVRDLRWGSYSDMIALRDFYHAYCPTYLDWENVLYRWCKDEYRVSVSEDFDAVVFYSPTGDIIHTAASSPASDIEALITHVKGKSKDV